VKKRAIASIRVSRTKGREGDSFSSPKDQLDLIKELCAEQDWDLPPENIYEELNVSGNAPLEERPELSKAVTKILTGSAEVLVGAFNERLWWSHEVRAQVLRLVQEAGGEVWSADSGRLSGGTAADDFSGEVRTSADRFSRRQNAEKARKAVVRAVARGVVPFDKVPPGLGLDEENRVIHTDELPIVVEAFELRDEEATIREARAFLKEHGIHRSYHGVQAMFGNRLYLGEIHFGELVNLHAHDPAVDRALFERVNSRRTARGRRAKSDRLLARLGVLRCGSCGARMIVGTQRQNGRNYPFYRCPPVGDCDRRVTISATMAETVLEEAAKERIRGEEGRASASHEAQADAEAAAKAQADFDAAIRAFAGLDAEPAAVERLSELRETRDRAQARADHSRDLHSTLTVTVADWDRLSLKAKRGLIRATVEEATVSKGGTGAGRISVKLFGE